MRQNLIGYSATLGVLVEVSSAEAATTADPGPVTRILAVGTILPGTDIARVRALLPEEVRATVELYLAGQIVEWYSRADQPGVVFLLDMRDTGAASALLASLPLGRGHLMQFKLTPLGPLSPLRHLTAEPPQNR